MNIIVRSNFVPKVGKKNLVFDKNKEKIGYIYDLVGSINKPYILVKPFKANQDNSKLIGESLFLRINSKNKKFKRKGRKT